MLVLVTMEKVIFVGIFAIIQTVNSNLVWDPTNPALDQSLYEEVLDPVLCENHINFIQQDNLLRLQFIDAGIRIPKGILEGNTIDLGNYHQCLGIQYQLKDSELHGKYCMIRVPFNQTLNFPTLPGLHDLPELEKVLMKTRSYDVYQTNLGTRKLGVVFNNDSRLIPNSPFAGMELRLAVCIPKPCSTKQAIESLLYNISELGFEYTDEFCRMPNDKPWVAADYIAVVLFSLIGFLSLISTCFDVLSQFVFKKEVSTSLCTIFSIYTNGKRLMNFQTGPDALNCIDGIRALAMVWVLIGHTFSSEIFWSNPIVGYQWLGSLEALWLNSAHTTVDTFFTLSGLLVVYTTAGKLSRVSLLRNLHLFYLNRLLRMFPVLATGVLLEASVLNRISDGPYWVMMADLADRCRAFWWSTLLHIQNFMNPERTCIGQSWYLAIDVQLHILSPLVLFWVLSSSSNVAWLALAVAFVLQLSASTVYNYFMEFPSTMSSPGREDEMFYYMFKYYVNTLTRASPFMVGMIIGYILASCRGKKVRLTKGLVIFNWAWSSALLLFIVYTSYPIIQPTWNSQPLDTIFNSFIRPAWALGLGWIIIACVLGYAGPINWLLSLRIWKLPARLSYAMYILHYALMVVVNSSAITPTFFSVKGVMFKFLGHFGLTFIVSFVVVLFIDVPCSVIFKKLLSAVPKNQRKSNEEQETANKTGKEV